MNHEVICDGDDRKPTKNIGESLFEIKKELLSLMVNKNGDVSGSLNVEASLLGLIQMTQVVEAIQRIEAFEKDNK